ncbi:MAG: HEAT repeat domain-containing protein [Desulfobacterales bacterium]|nr:HEAT repeat domain-containing protein [Desulfobacterales bacterium]
MKRRFYFTFFILISFIAVWAHPLMAQNAIDRLATPAGSIQDYQLAIEEIVDQGQTGIPELVNFIEAQPRARDANTLKQDWDAKVTAMNLLGEFRSEDSLDVLENMLMNTDNLSAINNSARTIGRIGGKRALSILKNVLVSCNQGTLSICEYRKRAAIVGLGLCGNPDAVPLLKAELTNESNDMVMRIYAAGSLGLLGVSDGFELALIGLNSDDNKVRLSSIQALGLIGDSRALSAIEVFDQPDTTYMYRSTAKLAKTQIKASKMSTDDQVNFIYDELLQHPRTTEYIIWGTSKLKELNTPKAKESLKQLSGLTDNAFFTLRHAAFVKIKTMK